MVKIHIAVNYAAYWRRCNYSPQKPAQRVSNILLAVVVMRKTLEHSPRLGPGTAQKDYVRQLGGGGYKGKKADRKTNGSFGDIRQSV